MESDKSFGLTSGSVEERRTQYIHTLYIDTWFRAPGFGSVRRCRGWRALRMLDDGRSVLQFWAPTFVGGVDHGRFGELLNFGIVELPRYGIEETDQGGFANSTLEERIRS